MLHFNFRSGKKEKSAKEYRECAAMHMNAVKSSMGTFLQTGVVIVATVIAMIALGRAWFVSNTQVGGASATISAADGNKFSIATLKSGTQGIYDTNEPDNEDKTLVEKTALARALNKFFRADRNGRDDDDGNHYTSFQNLPILTVGTSIFTDENKDEYILGDSDGISLMVNAESNANNTEEFEHVGPGSYGKFTFYIIPHIDDLEQVKLSVSLKPFTLEREGEASDNKKATASAKTVENNDANKVLLNMLQGHILLFTGKNSETGNYEERILPNLEADGRISFKFEKNRQDTSWVKDQPEPITIYWIWPKRFENIKYCGQENSVFKSECTSYSDLLTWVNTNKQYVVNLNAEQISLLIEPWEDMTNKQFAQWSNGYNKGDQLIGDNIAFFQWIIEAE